MKRLVSLLCALCLLFSFAFAENYAATNPYTIDDIGMTLALPDVLSVTSCDVGETTIACASLTMGVMMSATPSPSTTTKRWRIM